MRSSTTGPVRGGMAHLGADIGCGSFMSEVYARLRTDCSFEVGWLAWEQGLKVKVRSGADCIARGSGFSSFAVGIIEIQTRWARLRAEKDGSFLSRVYGSFVSRGMRGWGLVHELERYARWERMVSTLSS